MEQQDFYVENHSDQMEFFFQRTYSGAVAANAHIHDTIELLYITAGEYTVFLDHVEYKVTAGDLILFCSNSIHRIIAGNASENSYYVIKVKPSMLLDHSVGASFLMRFAVSRSENRCLWTREMLAGGGILSSIDAMIAESEQGGHATELAMRLHLLQLLLAILRDGSMMPEEDDRSSEEITRLIYTSIVYVRKHFREDLSAAALASKMGVSYSYFSRSFGRIAGKSFKEYLNLTRVNFAEQLLLTTQKSVTEIAAECGYNNVSYFISVYRKMKGTTPRRTSFSELGERPVSP